MYVRWRPTLRANESAIVRCSHAVFFTAQQSNLQQHFQLYFYRFASTWIVLLTSDLSICFAIEQPTT